MWNIFKRKDKRKDDSTNNEAVNAPEEPIEEQEPENPDSADEATQAEVEREAVQAAAFEETEKADPAEECEKAETKVPTPEAAEQPVKAPAKKQSIFSKLFSGLKATRDTIFGGLFVENGEKINDEFYDELEEAMIISDMGMATAEKLLSQLRKELKAQGINTRTEARKVMIKLLAEAMKPETEFLPNADNAVIMIVGVNGVGKTTSIGKLASMYKAEGKSVMLAAADTFRAAAAEQLTVWAERADVPIVKHGEGADPAAVVFDSIASFKAKKCNLLICDTAGTLHNKVNLTKELSKMRRVISRELPDAPVEVLLVLDATTGQNAIAQAKAFGENAGLTGIILTKLDGTAKGGVVVAVKDELGLPVRFVGVGEGIDDLQPFDAETFAEALI